jgi:hypothetical protein
MDTLKEIVHQVVSGYAGEALNGVNLLTTNADNTVFTVVSIGDYKGERIVDMGLVVRLIGDQVVIERDANDEPVVNALRQAGVPREKIVLAYAGETLATQGQS